MTLARRLETQHASLTPGAVREELELLVPMARWGQSLQAPLTRGLEEVGGLHTARETLTHTLLWPSRHPKIFQVKTGH